MQHLLKNVHNVGEGTWPPVHAGSHGGNNDLATSNGPYTKNPGAQAALFPFYRRIPASPFDAPTRQAA